MAKGKKRRRKRSGAVRTTDEKLISRLEEEAPGVLTARISDATFDAAVEGLISESPLSVDVPHFYCRRCGEYHLKTHPHHAEMLLRKRSARGG